MGRLCNQLEERTIPRQEDVAAGTERSRDCGVGRCAGRPRLRAVEHLDPLHVCTIPLDLEAKYKLMGYSVRVPEKEMRENPRHRYKWQVEVQTASKPFVLPNSKQIDC